ncbi:MAG: D-aminoacyl-tRNA deacylase [bacterium]
MIAIVQRVSEACVSIEGKLHSKIDKGLLILVGICNGDGRQNAQWMAKKIIDLRIFTDENEKMNLSVKDIDGEVLVISQFTLCSDKGKSGNRPSFGNAEEPEAANLLYELLVKELKDYYNTDKIRTGIFSAKMEVKLINEGPVTIILEK